MEEKKSLPKLCQLDLSTSIKVKLVDTTADREAGYRDMTLAHLLNYASMKGVECVGEILVDVNQLSEKTMESTKEDLDRGREM